MFVMGLLFLRREKTTIQEIQVEGEQEDALEETEAKKMAADRDVS